MEQYLRIWLSGGAERACGTGLRHLPWPGLRHAEWSEGGSGALPDVATSLGNKHLRQPASCRKMRPWVSQYTAPGPGYKPIGADSLPDVVR